MHFTRKSRVLLLALAALGACTMEQGDDGDTAAAAPATAQPLPVPATPPDTMAAADSTATLSIEVDTKTRKLHVSEDGAQVATYGVAVGSEKWPTQPGEWAITQVVWNPEWIPPQDESWTEDKEPKDPGDPDNPLGRVQLVYDLPRTIHGTNNPSSIGKAVSHGSIRMRNAEAVELAKRVMDAAGAGKDDAWYANVQENRREKVIVNLPKRVPIQVR